MRITSTYLTVHLSVALLLLLLLPVGGVASTSSRVRTFQQLNTVQGLTNAHIRAFAKGQAMRVYVDTTDEQLLFKASWGRHHLPSHNFKYESGVLKFDPTPPRLPEDSKSWKEVEVLSEADSRALWRATIDTLGSALALEHGMYVRHVLGDLVIYRDSQGVIRSVRFSERPPGLRVDRQLGIEEFAILGAQLTEKRLRATHPGQTRFLLVTPPQTGGRTRFTFLDLDERRCVVLVSPYFREDPGGELPVVNDLSSLAQLLVVDHGIALLKNPVSTVGKTLNLCLQFPFAQLQRLLPFGKGTPPTLHDCTPMDLPAFEQWLDVHTGTPREKASLRLLIDGEQFFPALEREFAGATNFIHSHVSIFDRDDIAVHVADLLRAASGHAQVKVLVDHNSSRASGNAPPGTPMPVDFVAPKSILSYLRKDSKVHVRQYLNPLLTSDHTKVISIDNRCAYIGGMNFGREYRYEWHDFMVEVRGPVLASLEHDFEKAWAHAGPLGDLAYAAQVLSPGKPASKFSQNAEAGSTRDWADVRRLYTRTGSTQIRRVELEAIRRARCYIYVENPYLFDHKIVVELAKARNRGVDVRVVLPSENDIVGALSSNYLVANRLFESGVRVYFYPGMTHAKALLADGWACFGSANFNALSLRYNQEADLATSDPEFARKFKSDLFETDFAKSHELTEPISVGWDDHLVATFLNFL